MNKQSTFKRNVLILFLFFIIGIARAEDIPPSHCDCDPDDEACLAGDSDCMDGVPIDGKIGLLIATFMVFGIWKLSFGKDNKE